MHIVHLASELAPIAKVGGLGDVVYGLSKELSKLGHKVEIILPKYDTLDHSSLKNLKVDFRDLWSFEGTLQFNNTIWSAETENLRVLLIEAHHPSYYFSRGKIYGCPDDVDRFLYFTRAAMEFLFKSGRVPDAIHLHDWPAAAGAALYQDMYLPLGLKAGGTMLTIHSVEHQGICSPQNLTKIGLRGEDYLIPGKMQDPAMPHLINLLKGGIEYATAITTVSPTYEKEIQTPLGGHGLHESLAGNAHKLKGILNGIDEDYWNPAKDRHLKAKYEIRPPLSEENMNKIFKAKEDNKRHLRNELNLIAKEAPLVGCVTRLVEQKGPKLIASAIRRTLHKGGQFVLLGSSGSDEIEEVFKMLKEEFGYDKNLYMQFDRDEGLAHRVYAASDILVIPSLWEPCGLTQMIALRYATVPLVRKTGGLADTIFDIDNSKKPASLRNGYVFEEPTEEALFEVVDRAIDAWNHDSVKWVEIVKNGASQNYTWKNEAQEYIKIYRSLSKNLQLSRPIAKKSRLKKSA